CRRLLIGAFCPLPQPEKGSGKPLWFDPMGRVEVVALLKPFKREVRKDLRQALCHPSVVVGVTLAAKSEVDRLAEQTQALRIELAGAERAQEGTKTGGPLCHPGRGRFRRRWRRRDTRPEL